MYIYIYNVRGRGREIKRMRGREKDSVVGEVTHDNGYDKRPVEAAAVSRHAHPIHPHQLVNTVIYGGFMDRWFGMSSEYRRVDRIVWLRHMPLARQSCT